MVVTATSLKILSNKLGNITQQKKGILIFYSTGILYLKMFYVLHN